MAATESEIRIIAVPVVGEPVVQAIANTLAAFRAFVGGYIECVPIADGVHLVVNEEGVLDGLPPNRCGIVGPFFVTRADEHGDNVSLTDDDVGRALAWIALHAAEQHSGVTEHVLYTGAEALEMIERAQADAALRRAEWEGLVKK